MNLFARVMSIAAFGLPWLCVAVLRHISRTRRTFLQTVIGLPLLILVLVMIGGVLFYGRLMVVNLPAGFWLSALFSVMALSVLGMILEMRPVQTLLGLIERWLYDSMLALPPTDDITPVQNTPTETAPEESTVIVVASIATKGVSSGVSVKEALQHIPPEMRELVLRDNR